MTHISYETAKKLKDFLKESAPEPMGSTWYSPATRSGYSYHYSYKDGDYPAYQLHDLLSKPFCEAMAKMVKASQEPSYVATGVFWAYYIGGLPAVEKSLTEMMEGK